MAQTDINIAGLGGQGSILAGVILGTAAVTYDEKFAVQTQAYSSELRGGYAATWVIVSDGPVNFPRVTTPDILVAQAQDAINRFAKVLKPKGILIVDSDMIPEPPTGIERVVRVPATSLARNELKAPVVANMIMLGALIRASNMISYDAMVKNLNAILGEGKAKLIKLNKEALELGYNYLKE